MNPFLLHQQPSLRCHYSCFDRILLNVVVQLLQIPGNVVCFFRDQRQQDVDRQVLGGVARQDPHWVQPYAAQHQIAIVRPDDFEDERRENWTDGYFHNRPEPFGVGVIRKSRAGARIAIADQGKVKPHLDLKTASSSNTTFS